VANARYAAIRHQRRVRHTGECRAGHGLSKMQKRSALPTTNATLDAADPHIRSSPSTEQDV